MKCQYASATDEFHGWECKITGGECELLFPDAEKCPSLIDELANTITAEQSIMPH